MRLLAEERAVLERYLPGLDQAIAALPLEKLEVPGNDGLRLFREAGGCGLLVPTIHGGSGATAYDAVRCARAIGSRSPSLGVATTMHHFSVASLVALASHSDGFEWMLLDGIANDRLLVSSAFAEGRSGQGILSPTVTARREGSGWLLNGRKKPCSLSRSMDVITASVALHEDGGDDAGAQLGVALVPASSPGISVAPFWASSVLAGAESDEVILEDVFVDDQLMLRPQLDPASHLDNLQTVGLVWFTLLVTATYLGVASALVERVLEHERGSEIDRLRMTAELEGAFLALTEVTREVDADQVGNDTLSRSLLARFSAQGAVARSVADSLALLGGMAFIRAPEVAYLASASTAIQFHPPSLAGAAAGMATWQAGGQLRID